MGALLRHRTTQHNSSKAQTSKDGTPVQEQDLPVPAEPHHCPVRACCLIPPLSLVCAVNTRRKETPVVRPKSRQANRPIQDPKISPLPPAQPQPMGAVVSAIAFPHPPRDLSAHSLQSAERSSQLKFFTTEGGDRIPAIHIKRPSAKFTVIYSHGNAEDVGLSLPYLDLIAEICDVSVLAYEYPGYSVSEGGNPSELGTYQAINAAFHYISDVQDVGAENVILFGRSLGTGPSVDLAARTPRLAGLILQSPLESGIRCAIGTISSCTLYPLDIFRSYQKIDSVKCPVLIMHGTEDEVVPCDNGRALYAALETRPNHQDLHYDPIWIPGRGHNDLPEMECLDHCRRFLAFLKGRQEARAASLRVSNGTSANPASM